MPPDLIHFPLILARTAGERPLAEPIQLPLFPDQAALTRVRPERNEWRFYRIEVWPDLFGRALLARHWGRLGTPGRIRLDPHPDAGAAINALARLARSKRRRGYQDLA
jgi:predicted DNA-binding WGR domain protein